VSHEFMVPTEAGEDMLVQCPGCDYAANLERAACAPPAAGPSGGSAEPLRQVHTPDMRTIEQVCGFLQRRPEQMIKTLVFATQDGQPFVALVRGDHEINLAKLARAAGAAGVGLADAQTIEKLTGAAVGFAGPQGLQRQGVRIICDRSVAVLHDAASGANRTDYHAVGIEPGRDFALTEVADIRSVVAGDRCPRCQAELVFKKCIEVGHVFKLGTKYSEAMRANFLDEAGQAHPMVMGCYGIGVNRIVAAAIESHHDEDGIIWPMSLAPFHVEVLALDVQDSTVMEVAERLHGDLEAAGAEVLLDDRPIRPGPKFMDADLIGLPLRVTVGKRSLQEGVVELKRREGDEVTRLAPDQAAAEVRGQVQRDLSP
jgi:prolyl-tRNA synthetase